MGDAGEAKGVNEFAIAQADPESDTTAVFRALKAIPASWYYREWKSIESCNLH